MRQTNICVSVAILLLTGASLCFTQGQQPPAASPQVEYYQLAEIRVNPGMAMEFENFLKTDMMPLLKKNAKWFGTLRASGYGDPTLYLMLSPADLASLDGPGPMAGLSQDARNAMMAKVNRIVAGMRYSVLQGQPKMTLAPKSGYALKVAMCTRTIVAPGRNNEYEKSMEEMVGLIGKANAAKGILSSRFGMGGNTNEYMTTVLTDSFAELGMFYMAMGKAAAEAKLSVPAGVVVHQEVATYRYVPELSFETAP